MIMQVQRYEGASTDYGPYTLDAYLQEFGKLAVLLAKVHNQSIVVHGYVCNQFLQGGKAEPGCTPPYYRDKQWALHTPVVFNAVPSGKKFGDVNTDANSSYKLVGLDTCM